MRPTRQSRLPGNFANMVYIGSTLEVPAAMQKRTLVVFALRARENDMSRPLWQKLAGYRSVSVAGSEKSHYKQVPTADFVQQSGEKRGHEVWWDKGLGKFTFAGYDTLDFRVVYGDDPQARVKRRTPSGIAETSPSSYRQPLPGTITIRHETASGNRR